MRRTQIVATIGPASQSVEVLRQLIEAGMDVARLNMSHGDQDYHARSIENIRRAAEEVGRSVAILADLQGAKLRVGTLAAEDMHLTQGQTVTLSTRPDPAPDEIPVPFPGLPEAVLPGDRVLIDDGLLELQVLETTNDAVRCLVMVGGVLKSHKGINLPQASLDIPAITPKDRRDVRFAVEQRVDWIALSYVRSAQEVQRLKAMIFRDAAGGGPRPRVMAKIETPEAVIDINSIIAAADGVMVARGDLGLEMPPEEVPLVQKMVISACNRAGVFVVTATQMLDSMTHAPRPTRAEVSDVTNAILDGTDAVMLSAETATGRYPVEAVRTMARIIQRVEAEQQAPIFDGGVARSETGHSGKDHRNGEAPDRDRWLVGWLRRLISGQPSTADSR
jgi:pyruvate kinase